METKTLNEVKYYRSDLTTQVCFKLKDIHDINSNANKIKKIKRKDIHNYIMMHECQYDDRDETWIDVSKNARCSLDAFLDYFGVNLYKISENLVSKIYEEACDYFYNLYKDLKTQESHSKEENKEEDNQKVLIEIDMPKTCGDCPFYRELPYQFYEDSGIISDCTLGCMKNKGISTRDKSYKNTKFPYCSLKHKEMKIKK